MDISLPTSYLLYTTFHKASPSFVDLSDFPFFCAMVDDGGYSEESEKESLRRDYKEWLEKDKENRIGGSRWYGPDLGTYCKEFT